MKKNDSVELFITGTTAEGMGVGRSDGIAVFVPMTAEGDLIKATIVKVGKSFAYGKAEEIIIPSDRRVPPDCEHYRLCGGCVFRHISYEEECRVKERRINDTLRRIGGANISCEQYIAAENPDRYRNKAQLPCRLGKEGEPLLGFYATHSHRVIDCGDCLLQPAEFAAITEAFRKFLRDTDAEIYDEEAHKGRVRHLYLRRSNSTGEIMACVVVNGNGLHGEETLVQLLRDACPAITGVIINSNREKTGVIMGKKFRTVWGSDCITETLRGLKFSISPASFFQVNPVGANLLYERAFEYAGLTGTETLLDLYCGTGTIGLSMAAGAKQIIGVEIVPEAVENARQNAETNGIENAEFICSDAEQAAVLLKERGITPDVVVLDPPRKGCTAKLLSVIAEMKPRRIVYISCDCATLARDVKLLSEYGFAARRMTGVDMFPRTAHVETCVLLENLT
ncbi:MAG: 23S rRNA (uracil(1939)-C(5))-methyltransferase RlmD [Oscillospiraceae bacterium]|nr:23S rRNA (uracil(1939)-C(5))-methyltransferase RlmD [Oscillospiraceae bacterium]